MPQNQLRQSASHRKTTFTDSGVVPALRRAAGIGRELEESLAGALGDLRHVEAELRGGAPLAERRRVELAALIGEARRACERAGAILATVRSPAPPAPTPAAPRRARVLIVDDEPAVGRTLGRTLRGHEVSSVSRAAEALARLEGGEHFDLILCDLMMPEMGGVELYEAVAAFAPAIAARIVFMTGGVFTDRVDAFLRRVPNRHVSKPFRIDEVRGICEQALAAQAAR